MSGDLGWGHEPEEEPAPEGQVEQLWLIDPEAPARPDWALSPAEKRRNAARLREVRRGTGL